MKEEDIQCCGFSYVDPETLTKQGVFDELPDWNEHLHTEFVPVGRWGAMVIVRDTKGFWVTDGEVFSLIVSRKGGNKAFIEFLREGRERKPLREIVIPYTYEEKNYKL